MRRHAPAYKHSLRRQTLWPDRLPPINTDQFSSSSSPDCLCGSQVYASGYKLATMCTSSASQALGDTHLRLVHTRRLTHSRFHRWEFTALIATTANHITAQHCFTMTTHYSTLHFIQLGLPRLKNTAHQGGGQRKGILRLWTQTAFSEQALEVKYACLFMACKDVQNYVFRNN